MTTTSCSAPPTQEETEQLQAVLEVEPASEANCGVVDSAPNAADVTQTISYQTQPRSCQSEIIVVDDGESKARYVSSNIGSACVCETINQFEAVFDIEGVHDGALVVSLVVRDRHTITDIVEAVRATGATVRLRRIGRSDDARESTLELDVTSITEKQREAVDLAVECGYYDTPRQATLSDLADELGISKSAVSQRLTAVESKLIAELVDATPTAPNHTAD